jgi:hypothetical protein
MIVIFSCRSGRLWNTVRGYVWKIYQIMKFSTRIPFACDYWTGIVQCAIARTHPAAREVYPGLPWVALTHPNSPKGATRYGDNRLGTFEPDRVRVSGPFRAKRYFAPSLFGVGNC